MKEERTEDLIFVLYLLAVLALALLYFTVPERVVFLSNAIEWWIGILDVIFS